MIAANKAAVFIGQGLFSLFCDSVAVLDCRRLVRQGCTLFIFFLGWYICEMARFNNIAILAVCNCIGYFAADSLIGVLETFRAIFLNAELNHQMIATGDHGANAFEIHFLARMLAIICMLLSTLSIIMHCKCLKVWE